MRNYVKKWYPKSCLVCGATFYGHGRHAACSSECKRKRLLEQKRQEHRRNADKYIVAYANYRKRNRTKILERRDKYADQEREQKRRYRMKNKDELREKDRIRRAAYRAAFEVFKDLGMVGKESANEPANL